MNARLKGELAEIAAFHRTVARDAMGDFGMPRLRKLARKIYSTHTRYAEVLEGMVNSNLQALQICRRGISTGNNAGDKTTHETTD